ncbi:hypothetical protein TPHA_0E02390 [Tetrapisispora phaffii CBS 4417]|uniref:ATP-dependent (S)-NAD(P)H-hydrate dehydratase n=1 Tax=Tetrapisispora phaffii (strain ATCC 24235 / CBS 4417 / NBRC 1672 / NRRL Y-8282 / UCD 70-5) TaxID=1071381 RepID=G8BTV3_TETPH|nr:hypothetical protein TPHA_0E02390 [Tetrapisispora phaffii CBS 4417]CCE63331.1 hypothetical protein TPHA_0E02390 [Tetrapisispora phaffii CBS 4417]
MSILNRASHSELIKLAYERIIPPLLPTLYKGQSSKICVIGGSEDYTGAPYFSANAASLMGCDLTHIICEENAATVIKSYNPNLMVHPYLVTSRDNATSNFEKIKTLLARMYTIVIGPGLGREAKMINDVKRILKIVLNDCEGKIPIILDADSLYVLSIDDEMVELVKQFPLGKIILTPNVIEFKRICDRLLQSDKDVNESIEEQSIKISELLNCTVFCKGETDQIVASIKNNKSESIILNNTVSGSNKRVGGQGDTLTGTIACMLAYSRAVHDFKILGERKNDLKWIEYVLLSCYIGSSITRTCSNIAYKEKGRAMQTTDMNSHVGKVFQKFFPDKS